MAASYQYDTALKFAAARAVTGDIGSGSRRHEKSFTTQYTNGTGTSKIDEVWSDKRTVNSGADETLDLNSLTQTDGAGATERSGIDFSKPKVLFIRNTNTAGGSGLLTVGGAASTAWDGAGTPFVVAGGKIDIEPGGVLYWESPVGASTSSANNLKVAASGANTTYEIMIAGESN